MAVLTDLVRIRGSLDSLIASVEKITKANPSSTVRFGVTEEFRINSASSSRASSVEDLKALADQQAAAAESKDAKSLLENESGPFYGPRVFSLDSDYSRQPPLTQVEPIEGIDTRISHGRFSFMQNGEVITESSHAPTPAPQIFSRSGPHPRIKTPAVPLAVSMAVVSSAQQLTEPLPYDSFMRHDGVIMKREAPSPATTPAVHLHSKRKPKTAVSPAASVPVARPAQPILNAAAKTGARIEAEGTKALDLTELHALLTALKSKLKEDESGLSFLNKTEELKHVVEELQRIISSVDFGRDGSTGRDRQKVRESIKLSADINFFIHKLSELGTPMSFELSAPDAAQSRSSLFSALMR